MRAVATVLLAIAVSAGAGGSPAGRAEAAPREWATGGVQPIGQPIAVGGTVVGFVLRDKHVYARGMDPADGSLRWEREVTSSKQAGGIELLPQRVGDAVTFLEPQPRRGVWWARAVVVDAATGQVRQSSPAALFRTTPHTCFGDRAVCVMAQLTAGQKMTAYRLDLVTGDFSTYTRNTVPTTARYLGAHGLIDLGGRPAVEEIGVLRDGVVRWHRPLADAFPAGFSTDWGWNWTLYEKHGVYAGSVFGHGVRAGTTLDRDLHADSGSAGLDEKTGAVLWHEVGTVVGCAGQVPLRDEAVRCRVHGREHIVRAPLSFTVKDLDVVLEGFDPRTGRTTWSVPMGASEQLGGLVNRAAVAGAHAIVARHGDGGPRLIDLTGGTVTTPTGGSAFWCLTQAGFDFYEATDQPLEGPLRFRRVGDNVATACDADGSPVASGSPSPDAWQAVGAVAAGYAVVGTATGYRGMAVPAGAYRGGGRR